MGTNNAPHVAVIGSGPTGLAATKILLEHGIKVTVFDGGFRPPPQSIDLKEELAERITKGIHGIQENLDFVARLTNPKFSPLKVASDVLGLIRGKTDPRQIEKQLMGSDYSFHLNSEDDTVSGLYMPRSMAVGGLSNAWGAACYGLRPDDYKKWPIPRSVMAPWFQRANDFFQVTGEDDGLSEAYPWTGERCEASFRSQGSVCEQLLDHWRDHRKFLAEQGIYAGRSRLAVRPRGEGHGCRSCGMCLSGCPFDVIWSARPEIERLAQSRKIDYRSGGTILAIERQADGLKLLSVGQNPAELPSFDAVLLAAGPVSSFRIAARSVPQNRAEANILDNDMFVLPIYNQYQALHSPPPFALSEAAVAVDPGFAGERPIHLQLYQASQGILGPVGRLHANLPKRLRLWANGPLRRTTVGSIYLHSEDSRRYKISYCRTDHGEECNITLDRDRNGPDIARRFVHSLNRYSSALGLKPISPLMRRMPPGFSCHIGGTLPMVAKQTKDLHCNINGEIHGLNGVYAVDLSNFPFMPAQNPTFIAVANSMRIADNLATRLKTKN